MGLRDEEGDTDEEELCTVEMPDEAEQVEEAELVAEDDDEEDEDEVEEDEEETGEAAEEPGDEAAEW